MSAKRVQEDLISILRFIGEDTEREGLKNTPSRVIRSYKEIYSGYGKNPKSILTVFEETDDYSQMVVLKDIEIFSMCEHHMLPFFGKAHVAYLPDKRVIGISKLARLVDIYARRLQIQERIGQQVTHALMEYLKPMGAACTIEASHMCMRMRGCSKQHSTMITTSLVGCFKEDMVVRQEYLTYIK